MKETVRRESEFKKAPKNCPRAVKRTSPDREVILWESGTELSKDRNA